MKYLYLLLFLLGPICSPVALIASDSANLNQLISLNKKYITPIFSAYSYQLDKIVEHNRLKKKSNDAYFFPKLKQSYTEILLTHLISEVKKIDNKLTEEEKLKALRNEESLFDYFEKNIKPNLEEIMFINIQNKLLSSMESKIKEFDGLQKINLKYPTLRPKALTMNRAIKYPHGEVKFRQSDQRPEGDVKLEFTINQTGIPVFFKIISSTDKLLNDAAIKGVKSWRFSPGIKDGIITKTRTRLMIPFDLY